MARTTLIIILMVIGVTFLANDLFLHRIPYVSIGIFVVFIGSYILRVKLCNKDRN